MTSFTNYSLPDRLRLHCPKSRAGSTGRCNTSLQFTCRRLKAQGLPQALIEAQGGGFGVLNLVKTPYWGNFVALTDYGRRLGSNFRGCLEQ